MQRRQSKTFSQFVSLVLIASFLNMMFVGCSGGGSSKKKTDQPSDTKFVDEPVTTTTDSNGEAYIATTVGEEEYTYKVELSNEKGEAVDNIAVDYTQNEDKSFIIIRDPEHRYGSIYLYGTPNELAEKYGVVTTQKAAGSEAIMSPDFLILGTMIAMAFVLTSIAVAEVKFIASAYKIQQFYMTDFVSEEDDYYLYCKDFTEIAEFMKNRYAGVAALTNIVLAFVDATSPSGHVAYEIAVNVAKIAVDKLKEDLEDRAFAVYGDKMNNFIGKKVAVKVYPFDDNDWTSGIENMYATYEIDLQNAVCNDVDTYNVTGRIRESGSGLSGVEVTMGAETATSGSDGTYSFKDVEDGSYTINFSKSGYTFNQSSVTITIIGSDVTVDDVTASAASSGTGGDIETALTIQTPSGTQSGDVAITYTLQATAGTTHEFKITYGHQGIGQAHTAAIKITSIGTLDENRLSGVTPGTHIFIWDSGSDLPDVSNSTVQISMSYIEDGHMPWAEETDYFKIDNTDSSGGSGGGDPHDIEGLTFVTIPGGTFQMGDVDGDGYSGEKPVHTVTVSTFEMSIYEVTNAQYATYLNEALGSGDITASSSSVTGKTGDWSGQQYINLSGSYNSNNKSWIIYSNGSFSVASGKENWPVVYVSWYGSKAFAEYYGLDLPREGEWEYACRGGKQYKYGTDDGTISSSNVNYNRNVGYPTDVGSYSDNPYGLYDMSGNVYEWCSDWYDNYASVSVTDPTGATSGSYRVIRGGGWNNSARDCRSASRYGNAPTDANFLLGFRVVRRL